MGSLQDQLLKSGLVDEQALEEAKARKRQRRNQKGGQSGSGKTSARRKGKSGKKSSGDMSLASAYAQKARAEKQKKEQEKKARVADQEMRRKRNLELEELVKDKPLNEDAAEIPRYFEHIDRIRKVMVTSEQLKALNAGDIGLVSLRGRYLLVDTETYGKYKSIAPDLCPDLDKPSVSEVEEAGFEVPEDLRW